MSEPPTSTYSNTLALGGSTLHRSGPGASLGLRNVARSSLTHRHIAASAVRRQVRFGTEEEEGEDDEEEEEDEEEEAKAEEEEGGRRGDSKA